MTSPPARLTGVEKSIIGVMWALAIALACLILTVATEISSNLKRRGRLQEAVMSKQGWTPAEIRKLAEGP